jgi:hypothetical protein
MPILPALATELQCLFPATDKGQERWRWFMLTLQAILVPITASRTSNLLRAIATLFGVALMAGTALMAASAAQAQAAMVNEKDAQAAALGYVADSTKVDAKKFSLKGKFQ